MSAKIEVSRISSNKEGDKRFTHSIRITGKKSSSYQEISKSQFDKLVAAGEMKINNGELMVAEIR